MQKDNATIYGEFEYKDKTYPFVIQNHIMTVVQTPYKYFQEFLDVAEVGNLYGVTSLNEYIIMLGCRCISNGMLNLSGSVQFSMYGYVLQDDTEDKIDRLLFQSPALNAFYTPRRAWSVQKEIPERFTDYQISFNDDAAKKFTLILPTESIHCEIGFRHNLNFKWEETSALTIQTQFSMEFDESKTSQDIGKYYLYIRDFLAFANFERDIPIDDIVIYRKNDEGKLHKVGKATFFQEDCSKYIPDVHSSITYQDIGDSSISRLFVEVALQREQKTYNPYFLPEDRKDSQFLDRAKWLIVAISFEGEFDRSYSEYKYETDEAFMQAKDMLMNVLQTAIKESSLAERNKANKSLVRFKHLIKNCDTSIEEKFRFCLNHFSNEIIDIIPKFCTDSNITDPGSIDFAKEYSHARNNTAHGKIIPINAIDVVTCRLLRCFIYLLILERVSIDDHKQKAIITKMF